MTVDARWSDLFSAVRDRRARLGVIGLGYVGTPVACRFADAGFDVTGVDVAADRVAAVGAGRVPFEGHEPGLPELLADVVGAGNLRATTDYDALTGIDVVLIAVETPVDAASRTPRYTALRGALTSLGPRLRPGCLVVVESTLAPGTVSGLVVPVLEEASGLQVGEDVLVVHCPERVMPGRLLSNLAQMSRVVGGVTSDAAEVAVRLYRHVVDADLDPTDALTAEIVKSGENAYRDVQIAFANEMALLCESLGADVWRVRTLLNKSPGRNMLQPGAGVGGHCIPKDPWLLIANAGPAFEPRLIPAGRLVNDGMPAHVVGLLEDALSEHGVPIGDARVSVLGWAYLEDSDDDRNSPSAVLADVLSARGTDVRVHDPWVAGYGEDPVEVCLDGSDAAVIMVAHGAYRDLDWRALRDLVRTPVLVDGRRVYDPQVVEAAGWTVRTIGVGASSAHRADRA